MPSIKADMKLCDEAGFDNWQPGIRGRIEKEGQCIFLPPARVGDTEAEFNAVAFMAAIRNYPKLLKIMEKVVAYRAVYMAYAQQMVNGDLTELGDIVLDDAKSMYEIFDLLKRYKIS